MESLIIITGPIGAGKSAVAEALTERYRQEGRPAAEVDLDEIYLMMSGKPMENRGVWRVARQAAATLIDFFNNSAVEIVILEGQFWSEEERSEFQNSLIWDGKPFYVTLLVSYEEALRRVMADTTRSISRSPDFLKKAHAEFHATKESRSTTDLVLDSTHQTVQQLSVEIQATLARTEG